MSKSYSKESFIFNKGDAIKQVLFINSGNVAVRTSILWDRRNPCQFNLALLKDGCLLGLESPFYSGNLDYSAQALGATQVDERYSTPSQIFGLEPNRSLLYLSQIIKTLQSFSTTFLDFEKKYVMLHKMGVLAGVGMLYCEEQGFPISNKYKEFTNNLSEFLKKKDLKGKMFPLSQDLINYNFQEIRNESYGFATNTFLFINRLSGMFSSLSKALLEKDMVFRNYLIEDLSSKVPLITESFKALIAEMFNVTHMLLDSDGFLAEFHKTINKASKNATAQKYLVSLGSFVMKHLNDGVFGNITNYSQDFRDIFADLVASIGNFSPELVSSSGRAERSNFKAAPESFKNSVSQILNYSGVDASFREKFFENYHKWKAFDNPLSGEEDIRRIRNRVTQYYWDIYYHAFYQHKIAKKALIPSVELMFLFGFFDETLVDGKTITLLYQRRSSSYNNIPKIYTMYEWLSGIVDKTINPSVDAMGGAYEEMLRDLLRDNSNKDKKIEDLDKSETRLHFEVTNLAKEAAKVCNSDITSYVPILMEDQLVMGGIDLTTQFTTKESVAKAFRSIMYYDFSVFYREVRYKEGSMEEFVQKEILPVIILSPNVGKRGMVWQSKEKAKDSSGRMILSHISSGSLQHVIVAMFGFYRWEIVKELLGPLWNDISQLSLTAEYTDYASSIKKNKDLSEETKEKVLLEFKKYRSDRDRFANDYRKWILLESQSRPALNRVTRDFFFRQVPFPRQLRDQLKKMPAFVELVDKYNNIINRELNKLKMKYQRYTKSGGALPKVLQEYLDFHLR